MDVDKPLRISIGVITCLFISAVPMFAWKIGYSFESSELWRNVALSFAKIGGFGGMAMFALSLILSARYRWFDVLFGGLDKMYMTHRMLGTMSVILLVIHPFSLSLLEAENGIMSSLALWFKISEPGVWLGSLALSLLAGLVIWSVFAKSKYETFIKVHRLLGFVFIIGAAHAFFSGSIISSNSFVYWYMAILTAVATVSFFAYSVLGDILHRPLNYTLLSVKEHSEDIVQLELKPNRRFISFTPGQFVYITFESLLDHGYHPFSICSSKRSSNLVLAVRESGDFTKSLRNLKPGAKTKVKGSYGGFALQLRPTRKQLWIAGGIGVTPFISGATSLRPARRVNENDIEMIYATDDAHPYGIELLQAVEERNDIFNVTLFDKKTYGHVSFEALERQISDLRQRDIYICGPPAMLDTLRAEAEREGFAENLKYEEFNY